MDRQKWAFVKANVMPAFRRLLLDRPSPIFVQLFVTRKCNLKCSYCFKRRENQKDPSTRELKKRIDKLKELGCNMISFMGGEPTLREDLIELTRHCKSRKMFVSMDTNGVLLTKDYVDELAETGMNTIVVSLDGINRLPHSKKTLADNPKILDVLEYAYKEKGMRVFINIVLTKKNIDEVVPLIEEIKDKGIIFAICLAFKAPSDSMISEKTPQYTKKEIKNFDKLFEKLVEMKKQGYPMFEPLWYYENLKNFVRGKCNWKCRAGRHFFSVDTDGKFMLCSDLKPLKVNLLDLGKDYWERYKKEFDKQIKKCNKTCPENYAVCDWRYNENKWGFFGGRFT